MKKIFLTFIILSLLFLPLAADEIHLVNGKVVQGKILRITGTSVEYDPDGEIPFDYFPRSRVLKIVNKRGTDVYVTDGKSSKFISGKISKSDAIYFFDGLVLPGKIERITPTHIKYTPEGGDKGVYLVRGDIEKIVYSDGMILLLDERSESGFHYMNEAVVKEKTSWYIGFGLGVWGLSFLQGDFVFDDNEYSYADFKDNHDIDEHGVFYNVGLGYIFTKYIHIGAEFNVCISSSTERIEYSSLIAAVTWFPYRTGLLLKGGAGMGTMFISTDDDYETADVDEHGTASFRGFALQAGLGYAHWMGKTFNLCINADYSVHIYNEADSPRSSGYWQVYVSCYWF